MAADARTKKQETWRNRIVRYGEDAPDQLLANDKNWRIHGKHQQDALSGVLHEIGLVQNVIVNLRTAPEWGQSIGVETVVDGHLRIALAISEDQPTVPITYVDLSPSEEALVLATIDPPSAMAATDKGQLDALLREVSTGDQSLMEMLAGLAEQNGIIPAGALPTEDPGAQMDRAEELRAKWSTERGQLWEIPSLSVPGKCHRLLCGDSTSAEDVARLMGGERAALLATDPPYNVGVDYGDGVDDEKAEREYEQFSRAWFGVWFAVSVRQIVTPGWNNLGSWFRWFQPRFVAPWTKTNSMTRGVVSQWTCWEPVMFFGDQWARRRPNEVFNFPIGQQKDTANHPCPKPLGMWVDLLTNYSEPGDLVADAFGGSGTAFVAAEQIGRVNVACEIEPKYVAVALERLAGMGLEPRLVS